MAAVISLDDAKVKNIKRQVEFYFSDSNLPQDNFLKNAVQESEDGLVSLALICSFSRMRTHLGLGDAKPEDVPEETVLAVAEALRNSHALKVSEDGKKVGRASELLKPEEILEQANSRTIAAGPLPYDAKIEELESFFSQHGKVNSVRLPRLIEDKRLFCGTALVEFSEAETAEKVLNQSLVYAGVGLEINAKKDFDVEQNKKWGEFGKTRPNASNGSDGNSYPKGLIVAFKLKSLSTDGSKELSVAETCMTEVPDSTGNEEEQKGSENVNKELSVAETCMTEGSKELSVAETCMTEVLDSTGSEEEQKASENVNKELSGAEACMTEVPDSTGSEEEQKASENVNKDDTSSENVKKVNEETTAENQLQENEKKATENASQESEDNVAKCSSVVSGQKNTASDEYNNLVTREDLKQIFQKFGAVKYIDYTKGGESGYVRFDHPDSAVKARAVAVLANQGGLVVKNFVATLEAVSGDTEKEYWRKLRADQDQLRREFTSYRGRGGRHNRGGRRFDGKRSRDFDSVDGRPNKEHKVGGDSRV